MKRWPIIRHIRYLVLRARVYEWARWWGDVGIGLGVPNESDLAQLERIWNGDA
jgi:hypothetical protein